MPLSLAAFAPNGTSMTEGAAWAILRDVMKLLNFLVESFVGAFGITKPKPEQQRTVALALGGFLLIFFTAAGRPDRLDALRTTPLGRGNSSPDFGWDLTTLLNQLEETPPQGRGNTSGAKALIAEVKHCPASQLAENSARRAERQGPEGRPPNSAPPGRAGIPTPTRISSAVGAAPVSSHHKSAMG